MKILYPLYVGLFFCLSVANAQNSPKVNTKEIEEVITPVEISQKITNLDQFLPLSVMKIVPKNAIYADLTKCASERALDVIRRMTFDEKLKLSGGWSVMYFPAVERLGLRPVSMADGPQGIRMSTIVTKGNSTSFPGSIALAATWNTELVGKTGNAIAKECRALGVDVLLGPGINMQRFSVSGRNFEYFGEDPKLTSEIAVAFVKGVQQEKVIATAKHYVGNDQEFCRHLADCIIDERTLREIYLPPWEAVVAEADVKAIMTGNNMVNGSPCCMSKPLEEDLLRKQYGFRGIIMSDWSNTNYYTSMLNLGLTSGHSLFMSNNQEFAKYIRKEIEKSPERKAEIEIMLEKMIYPNLLTFFEMGIYDRHPLDVSYQNCFEENKKLIRKVAAEAICLLKNENSVLPVAKNKRILMMGKPELHSGTGSGFVKGYDHVSYADAMKTRYSDNFSYIEAPDEKTIRQADVVIYLLNKNAGEGYDVQFDEPKDEIAEISKLTKLNKNIIVIVNSANPMKMPWLNKIKGLIWAFMLGQERGDVIASIISGETCPSGKLPFTIEKDFADCQKPDFNYFGQEPYWYGHHPQYRAYWLGEKEKTDNIFHLFVKQKEYVKVPYTDGIFVGYRWYEKMKKEVHFPFGFGLSYTTFEYNSINFKNQLNENGKIIVSFNVKNTGTMAGSEIAQVYVSDKESSVPRPVKELKAFSKIHLNPGETKNITVEITKKDLAYWDIEKHIWKTEEGLFEILIGASSRDIRLKADFDL